MKHMGAGWIFIKYDQCPYRKRRRDRERPKGLTPCDVRGTDWTDWNDAKVPTATRSSSEREHGWADTPWSWTPGLQNCESASLVVHHPVLLPGKSHGRRSLVGCSPWGPEELDTTKRLHFHFSLSCIGEGNGSPLQCSCLENPRDGGAWWATIYGVAESRTRLRRLSSSSTPPSWCYFFCGSHRKLIHWGQGCFIFLYSFFLKWTFIGV